MSCPTCEHTMQAVAFGITAATNVHWCPRCGTLRCGDGKRDWNYHLPKLVERCRDFRKYAPICQWSHWTILGISESINKPEARK